MNRFAIALSASLASVPATANDGRMWFDRFGQPVIGTDETAKTNVQACTKETAQLVVRMAFSAPRPTDEQIKTAVDAAFERCMAGHGYILK